MRKRCVKTCISYLYINGWYVPVFLVLVGLKICLLSLIADSLRDHGNEVGARRIPPRESLTGQLSPHKSERQGEAGDNSPENVVARSPDNLMELEISPTGKNRTSSTSIWLVYNSVPRCNEEETVELIETLAIQNRFSHLQHEYQTPWPRFLIEQEQESLVTWFQYQHLPKSYNRHFFFVNFTKFQKYEKQRPIYMNIVRDPIDRIVLDYYNRRNKSSALTTQEIASRNSLRLGSGTEWYERTFEECVLQADPECRYTAGEKSFTLMVPFFCGQHNSCVVINDRWALQMAKFNIEREYSAVGVLEKMDQTLIVLEKFLPRFFSGAVRLHADLDKTARGGKKGPPPVSSYVRKVMESELYNEVELYQFIVSRLALQHSKLV